MRYKLRDASTEDRALVKQINDVCYRTVVVDQFGLWDSSLQNRFFEKKWNPCRYQMVEYAGQAVGVLSVKKGESDWFLSEIQILPDYQNAGIGTSIVKDLLAEADQSSVTVKLQVLKKNRSVSLYERLGFVHSGESETHRLMERPPNKAIQADAYGDADL